MESRLSHLQQWNPALFKDSSDFFTNYSVNEFEDS